MRGTPTRQGRTDEKNTVLCRRNVHNFYTWFGLNTFYQYQYFERLVKCCRNSTTVVDSIFRDAKQKRPVDEWDEFYIFVWTRRVLKVERDLQGGFVSFSAIRSRNRNRNFLRGTPMKTVRKRRYGNRDVFGKN